MTKRDLDIMYEPYGEGRRLKIDFEGLKEKLKEKLKNLKSNRWAAVIIAIIALAGVGGYTGWASYTAKITEFNSRIMILEKQMEACQNNLTSCFSELEMTESDLSTYMSRSEECESDLESTQSNLDMCVSERESLESEYSTIEADLASCHSDLEEKKTEYESLEGDYETLECNFAKDVCGAAGMNYYFVRGEEEIICCVKKDPGYCGEVPASVDEIKKITC